jgi:hypothetical protein
MMIAITILMYTVSLEPQLLLCVTIHNRCLDTELVPSAYFGNGVVCPKLFIQRIGIGTEVRTSFEISADQDAFMGALLYELQRNSDQTHKGILTSKAATKSTCIQMLVVWKMKCSIPSGRVVLLENVRGIEWNEENLKRLYDKNYDRLEGYDNPTSDAWFIDDNTVLKATFKVSKSKGVSEISISISEEEENNYAIRPLWFEEER